MVEPIVKNEIDQLCELIKKGNASIDIQESKAILLVGNTGEGKSTSVYILANKELRVAKNEETCDQDIFVDSNSNIPNITIGKFSFQALITIKRN